MQGAMSPNHMVKSGYTCIQSEPLREGVAMLDMWLQPWLLYQLRLGLNLTISLQSPPKFANYCIRYVGDITLVQDVL